MHGAQHQEFAVGLPAQLPVDEVLNIRSRSLEAEVHHFETGLAGFHQIAISVLDVGAFTDGERVTE